ncbi:MAG: killer suppression protein [Candidatus Cloacimonetes bacterium]|nr:killer suppression protein [Candidatus Cloacimonadota bacterium]MDD4560772.1 killer suppression protein [Candidatus Cloacimonadota bacterium]
MQISFTTKKLMKLLSSEKEMVRSYGPKCAKLIKRRLWELNAASDMSQVPLCTRLHPLTGNLDGKFAVDLEHPKRLILVPDCRELQKKADGSLDLSQIVAIMILGIVDYH